MEISIEQIEIAVRTKLIYYLSLAYGGLWYLNPVLFNPAIKTYDGVSKTVHIWVLDELQKEFNRSQEVFIKDHQRRYPEQPADAWKTLEVASMGTLSKLYKNLKVDLPEKGLNCQRNGYQLSAYIFGLVGGYRLYSQHHSTPFPIVEPHND